MRDVLLILAVALGGALAVGLPGALLLRMLRDRSVTTHLYVLLATTVLAVTAGVVAIAQAMFISPHDRNVLFLVISASAMVSLTIAWWLGHRLAADAVWASRLRDEERRAENSRRELVAWVSHDLRTPLAGLRAMAEALEDGVVADEDTVKQYHVGIRAEADRMAQLVDDLFELSRIQAGAMRLSMSRVALGDLVSDALASAAPLVRARGVRLVAAEHGWPTVSASERELSRAVGNLLSNAIRFTPYDGTVRISTGLDASSAWLAVSDTCGGIPEADLPRVFDVAYRGETARTLDGWASSSGGLGLAIVRGIIEAHGGRVEVANTSVGCRSVVHLSSV
jgi:signal transduction histidine kinase